MGHLKASNIPAKELREIRLPDLEGSNPKAEIDGQSEQSDLNLKAGDQIDVTTFEVGDKVQVTATSKGKGFAGTVKRHNFATGPKTHGSHNYRAPGSIGSGFPQHVFKGMRMAGQMGGEQVTTKNLKVIMVDLERNLIALRGAVPGAKKSTVIIRVAS